MTAPQPVAAAPTPTPTPVAAPAATAAQPAPVQAAPAQPAKKGGALKIVLIVLVILFFLGVVIIGAVVGVGYYAAKKLKQGINIEQSSGDVNIKTPFGNISSTNDADKVLAELGVDKYPGATPVPEGTNAGSFGGISVTTAVFESSDSLDQIEQFYKEKYPKSSIASSDENNRSMLFGTPKGMVTVVLKNDGGKTRIEISRMEGLQGNQKVEASE